MNKNAFLFKLTAFCLVLLMMNAAAVAEPTVYTAEAKGFGGKVVVTITMDDGTITDVKAEGAAETPGIGSQAIETIPAKILEAQSAEVEVVSGATISSKAVMEGARLAIEQTASAVDTGSVYAAEAKGFGGKVVVTITMDGSMITDVKAEGVAETPGIGSQAIETIPAKILEAQNTEVETVSGATISSKAVMEAARLALEQANDVN